MKKVVRETLQARTPAPGKDRPNGPVPNRIIEKQSATNMPLPHQAMTLSMCCRTMEGHSMECNGTRSRAQENGRQKKPNQLRMPPALLLRNPPKTVRARIFTSRQIDQLPI